MNKFYWSVGVSYSHLVLGWLRTDDLWNNNSIKVGNSTVYYKNWANRGIWTVNDLIDKQGNIMSVPNILWIILY
jgi:hypothetical protein